MAKILKKDNLIKLLEYLEEKYDLFAPAFHEKHENAFRKVSATEFHFSPAITPEGPKKYIFPAVHQMFGKPGAKKKVIFGVRHADIEGVALMDRAFNIPINDAEYFSLRDQYLIFGMDHSNPPKEGYDVYLQIAEEGYFATALTAAGKYILDLKIFDDVKPPTLRVPYHKDPILSHPRLSEAVEKGRDSKIWDKIAEDCLGCGICTYVCPACYCFDVQDSFDVNGKAKRERGWDSCLLANFANVAGDHNFRPELKQRLYNWYYHKFVRMPKELKTIGCVGCSRCIAYCPARINYLEVLRVLVEELEGGNVKKSVLAARGRTSLD